MTGSCSQCYRGCAGGGPVREEGLLAVLLQMGFEPEEFEIRCQHAGLLRSRGVTWPCTLDSLPQQNDDSAAMVVGLCWLRSTRATRP